MKTPFPRRTVIFLILVGSLSIHRVGLARAEDPSQTPTSSTIASEQPADMGDPPPTTTSTSSIPSTTSTAVAQDAPVTTTTTIAPAQFPPSTTSAGPPASPPPGGDRAHAGGGSVGPAEASPPLDQAGPPGEEPPRPQPAPIPPESLRDPGVRALVPSLEALVGRGRRLRAAIRDAEVALARLEAERSLRDRDQQVTEATARELRVELEGAEARLRQLRLERRRLAQAARRPSPPPRTLPLVQGAGRQDHRPEGVANPRRLRRAQAELEQQIGAWRHGLRRAERDAQEARQALAAKAQEVERQRQAVGALRGALALVPSDGEWGARLAAVLGEGVGAKPSAFALADIPPDYLDRYRRAALSCPGLSWTVLAAIGSAESSHGRSHLPGVHSGANSAGAMGPMQFLAETWAAYGVDADGDGRADVYQPTDAVFGAAHYLCASGAGDPARLADAIWAYNHDDRYVAAILSRAAAYGTATLEAPPADALALVDHPNLALSDEARADLLSRTADPRLVAVLSAAAAEHRVAVSVIKTGHAKYVRGTDRVSNHYEGRGVDIVSVDGVAVSPSNHAALALALALLTADPSLRPDEFGSPWPELSHFPGAFSDTDHAGHLHLGWRASSTPASPLLEGHSP